MAIQFDPNISKPAAARSGLGFWRLKELLVASGQWFVVGTGDGGTYFAYSGVTPALNILNQGSGGAYDALKTGNGAGTLVASNWSTGGWCVVRDAEGRELLFVDSNAVPDASWNSYGRVAYSRSAGFDGSVATASAIPGAAVDEAWIFGDRAAPNGVEIFDYNVGGYLHFYAHDTATNGVAGFGWVSVSTAGVVSTSMCMSTTFQNDSNSDPLVFIINGTTGKAWTSPTTSYALWVASATVTGYVSFTLPVEPQGGGKEVLTPFYVYAVVDENVGLSSADCGYPLDMRNLRFNGTARVYPDVLDCGSSVWLFIASNTCIPWPSTGTIPLGGTSTIRNGVAYLPTLTSGNGVVPVSPDKTTQYYQRVWDSTGMYWCYYTKLFVDPNPSPTDTSPNHSGSISNHSILRISVG